jgi:hypothetical protein
VAAALVKNMTGALFHPLLMVSKALPVLVRLDRCISRPPLEVLSASRLGIGLAGDLSTLLKVVPRGAASTAEAAKLAAMITSVKRMS